MLKNMLERFFGGNKEEKTEKSAAKERKPIVPDFQEDPEMEKVIHEYINACRDRFGHTHDGDMDKANEAGERAKKIESNFGEKMRIYLKPYMEKEVDWTEVPNKELDRWQTAGVLKNLDQENEKKK